MKKDIKKEADEAFISWIRSDIKLANDQLEEVEYNVMNKILERQSTITANRKAIKRSRDIIIIGYCILTFITLVWCLWDKNIFTYFRLPGSNWQPVTEEQYVKYYVMIFIAGIFSALSLIVHRLQLKNTGINRYCL